MPAGLDGYAEPITSTERGRVLAVVADAISPGRALVGIDGASGVGKSTFADELARVIEAEDRPAVRASIDSFHRPRIERYRRGPASPEGYYLDSHDLDALRGVLLDPFAAGRSHVQPAIFDEPTDQPVDAPLDGVPPDAVLVFDGLFLHRPELVDCWHVSVHLVADGRRERAWRDYLERDLPDDRGERDAEVERRIGRARRARYVDGQALYERDASPRQRATFVIDNDDLARPMSIRSSGRQTP